MLCSTKWPKHGSGFRQHSSGLEEPAIDSMTTGKDKKKVQEAIHIVNSLMVNLSKYLIYS